jgi:hypothetical protein
LPRRWWRRRRKRKRGCCGGVEMASDHDHDHDDLALRCWVSQLSNAMVRHVACAFVRVMSRVGRANTIVHGWDPSHRE